MANSIDNYQKFGSWTVLGYSHAKKYLGGSTQHYIRVRCDCGTEAVVQGNSVLSGRSTQCERCAHGEPREGDLTLYQTWAKMRSRCSNPKDADYEYYGARGVTVCEAWDSFAQFRADVGERPYGRTLDRVDTNGNYEPGNVRWATHSEQMANRRPYKKKSRMMKFFETMVRSEHGRRD